MTVNKRKKNSRQRGSHTHGWGSKKKHRGSGNRGGRGMAGTGKRADQKKPTILKEYGSSYFGKKGFKLNKRVQRLIKATNLNNLEQNLDDLVSKGIAKKENNFILIDLKELGYNKLLGKGKITKRIKVTVQYVSKHAVEKIEKIGGEVISSSKKQTSE